MLQFYGEIILSDSKGVALRVDYEDFQTPKTNSICDEECRDEGMLVGLEDYIEKNRGRDIFNSSSPNGKSRTCIL